MIKEHSISGLVVLSEPEWGCYPYIESIRSFLNSKLLDELVVSYNVYGKDDGSLAKIKELGVRVVPTIFDIEKYGWVSYGVARTMGYQGCKGDVVLMFDADGVLHEKDYSTLENDLDAFVGQNKPTGYWEKHRIYKPTVYWPQHKHSGIYNKKILGDRMDFFRADGKGAPNFSNLTPAESSSRSFATTLFGYEHLWDTKKVLQFKVNRYGRMIDSLYGAPFKTPEEYFDKYMRDLVNNIKERSKSMTIGDHPAIMQEKLSQLNETHFGFNFFGYQ